MTHLQTHFPLTIYYWGWCLFRDECLLLRQVPLPWISSCWRNCFLTCASRFNVSFYILKQSPVACNFPLSYIRMGCRHLLLRCSLFHAEVVVGGDPDILPLGWWKRHHTQSLSLRCLLCAQTLTTPPAISHHFTEPGGGKAHGLISSHYKWFGSPFSSGPEEERGAEWSAVVPDHESRAENRLAMY